MSPSLVLVAALVLFAVHVRLGDDIAAWLDAVRRQRAAFRLTKAQRQAEHPRWWAEDGLMADPLEGDHR